MSNAKPLLSSVDSSITEYEGLPGFEQPFLRFPWQSTGWTGRRPSPRIWAPATWQNGVWCKNVLALDPCVYCGAECEAIDHIDATARGGANDWSNFAAICVACNMSKGAKPLLAFRLYKTLKDERRHA